MDKGSFEISEFIEDKSTGLTGEVIGIAYYKYESMQYLIKSDFKGPDGTYANRWIPAESAKPKELVNGLNNK